MYIITAGDTGEPLKHIELEPVEVPQPATVPAVPAEPVPV